MEIDDKEKIEEKIQVNEIKNETNKINNEIDKKNNEIKNEIANSKIEDKEINKSEIIKDPIIKEKNNEDNIKEDDIISKKKLDEYDKFIKSCENKIIECQKNIVILTKEIKKIEKKNDELKWSEKSLEIKKIEHHNNIEEIKKKNSQIQSLRNTIMDFEAAIIKSKISNGEKENSETDNNKFKKSNSLTSSMISFA